MYPKKDFAFEAHLPYLITIAGVIYMKNINKFFPFSLAHMSPIVIAFLQCSVSGDDVVGELIQLSHFYTALLSLRLQL